MKYSEKVAKKLNELLEKNYDAEKGFKFAAENVNNRELKSFFKDKAQQRYDFGHELKSEIVNFGESPDKGSSLAGDAHRSWMNLKTSLSSDKEEAVLEEAVRGEKAAVEDYEEILKDASIPASTGNILLKQKNAIMATLNEVKSLEKQFD
ncbi:ferritin-like domain-containing protein [Autumnicola edwardsiae]|uniref:PA2169 family four-helix-bundle protein n=1 Tax=Autumnicola edwardsiae TaxID=3075594 RepID=A0ABU3CSA4_9FLAO|nr:PA2169 family four-helix-bundle protein [Zunongwangia sp. F297]MDT0649234.1 PA2169 family four-helix-bundle protein [Zunongwangia sp. F297]